MKAIDSLRSALSTLPASTNENLARIDRQLNELAQALVAEMGSPNAETPLNFESAAQVLHQLAGSEPSASRVLCCFTVAEYFYLAGRGRIALQPVEEAVACARVVGDDALVRRILNFRGLLLVDTGDYPGAIECYAEALDYAHRLPDKLAAASVWSNLGGALILMAAYRDAIACLERAVELVGREERPAGRQIRLAAHANIALACLHLEDFGSGLRSAHEAVESGGEPQSPWELVQRTTAEATYARLLIELKAYSTAKERVALAKHYAALSKLDRAEFEAAIAEGLVEVHSGQIDVGLSRLARVLDRARSQKGHLRDALIAMIKAQEAAGKHDIALVYLRELMMQTGDVRKESALLHYRLHLDRLERRKSSEPTTTVERVMEHHESSLRHKLAKQVAKQEMIRARIEMLERLAITAELRDDASGEHCFRVGRLAALLAAEYGCDDETCAMIDLAARLHDIGKVGIPDGILLKRGKLNEAEMQIVRAHSNIGAELLAQSHEEHLKLAEDIARFHHEWWNGNGYPFGIGETAIPLAARITALADVFDTLTHDRVYRTALTVQDALDEILRLKGKQFEPELTDRFVAMIPRLQREVGELDAHLAIAASESTFIRARRKIADTLRRARNEAEPPEETES
jgi:putative two-component system response regulator